MGVSNIQAHQSHIRAELVPKKIWEMFLKIWNIAAKFRGLLMSLKFFKEHQILGNSPFVGHFVTCFLNVLEGLYWSWEVFNMVLDSGMDRASQSHSHSKGFCQLLVEFNLYDAWRTKHPKVRDFSFYSHDHRS